MRQLPSHFLTLSIMVIALLLFIVAGMIGGQGFALDFNAILALGDARATHVAVTAPAIAVTEVGSAEGLLSILALATLLLCIARRFRDAGSLVAIVIGGRLAIELLKLAIYRPRPFFAPYPVDVSSLSFPSGHAGNSMTTFLALALIAAPERWRRTAVACAMIGSLAIGATRPLLGVHWPTDVIGGWSFGLFWVVGFAALSARWRAAAK